jgi:hypothetical protein
MLLKELIFKDIGISLFPFTPSTDYIYFCKDKQRQSKEDYGIRDCGY